MQRHALVDTATLGQLTIRSDGAAITGVYFENHWYLPSVEALGEQVHPDDDDIIAEAAVQVADYLAHRRTRFTVPMRTAGDPFRESVWRMLRDIPFGETTTYGAIARSLGNRSLAQAVGQAVGHNPISILIPCHRVIGATGKLTGFAGGVERKMRLLEVEEAPERSLERLF